LILLNEILTGGIYPPFKGKGQTKEKIKKPPADSGLHFSLLPFQTPTRLADGLGPGSALSLSEYAPNIGSPASIL
jgi:hypothetical protein